MVELIDGRGATGTPPDVAVDPDEVEQAAAALFSVSEGLYEDFGLVGRATSGLKSSVDTGEFKGVAEVAQAVDVWEGEVVAKLRARVEDIAGFLAVYSDHHIELDDFTAEMFTQFADPDFFPVDPASRTSPVPDPPEPAPAPVFYEAPGGGSQFTE